MVPRARPCFFQFHVSAGAIHAALPLFFPLDFPSLAAVEHFLDTAACNSPKAFEPRACFQTVAGGRQRITALEQTISVHRKQPGRIELLMGAAASRPCSTSKKPWREGRPGASQRLRVRAGPGRRCLVLCYILPPIGAWKITCRRWSLRSSRSIAAPTQPGPEWS